MSRWSGFKAFWRKGNDATVTSSQPHQLTYRQAFRKTVKRIWLVIRKWILHLRFEAETARWDETAITKILVVRLDRLGDMVLTTPFLQALSDHFKQAEIHVLAYPKPLELLRYHPAISRCIDYPEKGWLHKIRAVIALRQCQYDLIIDALDDYPLESALITYYATPRHSIGFAHYGRERFFGHAIPPDDRHSLHFTERMNRMLRTIGVLPSLRRPTVRVSPVETECARRFLAAHATGTLWVAIHPGGYYRSQRLAAEKFGVLAEKVVADFDAMVVLLGSANEKSDVDVIRSFVEARAVDATSLSLREMLAILANVDVLVCNNSGPLHMAGALGIPTVSTMGPTDPTRFWPVGKADIVVRRNLYCSPCEKTECMFHDCMNDITVDDLYSAVASTLKMLLDKPGEPI